MPEGLTDQDCVAEPPAAVVAVRVKLFGARDSLQLGIQLRTPSTRPAPSGAAVSLQATAVPAGSVTSGV